MSVQRFIVKTLFRYSYSRFIRCAIQAEQAQDQAWKRIQSLLSKGKYWNSQFNNFNQLTLADFPITDYESYRPAIEKTLDETTSIFNQEKILFWITSAGTTGGPKLYPLTKSYRDEFQQVNKPFIYHLVKNNKKIFNHKLLYFAGCKTGRISKAGIDIGVISNFNYKNIPSLFQKVYALPLEVFNHGDYFLKWAPLYALSQDISAFFSITPSIIESFHQRIKENKHFYLEQLEHPTPPADLPKVHFSSERKKYLQEILQRGEFTLQDLWPNFDLVVCWKSATCGLQLKQLYPIIGKAKVHDALYSATEGWMTIPLSFDKNGGPLHLGGHVYEFIEYGKSIETKNLIKPWQLTPGKRYEIFLTTSMGFIRYRLKDIVQCHGFLHHSPHLEFIQKEGMSISIGQIRIAEVHILGAFSKAALSLDENWLLAPASDGKSLEFIVDEESAVNAEWIAQLETGLRQSASDYDKDRHNGLLQAIQLRKISKQHALWQKNYHAQGKPKIILQNPVP